MSPSGVEPPLARVQTVASASWATETSASAEPAPELPILLLIADLDIRVIHVDTGELLCHLTLDPNRDDQPTGKPVGPPPTEKTKKTEP